MDGAELKRNKEPSGGKTVRFRVASANSGRVLTEVFKDSTAAWCASASDSVDSDCASNPETEGRESRSSVSEANSHLNGLAGAARAAAAADDGDGGGGGACEPDDLLLYASAKREQLFSNKRINICSKNGTIRGVRNKVNAGQVLFNNLSGMYYVSMAAECAVGFWFIEMTHMMYGVPAYAVI